MVSCRYVLLGDIFRDGSRSKLSYNFDIRKESAI